MPESADNNSNHYLALQISQNIPDDSAGVSDTDNNSARGTVYASVNRLGETTATIGGL